MRFREGLGDMMRYAMSVGDVCDRAFQLAMPEDTIQDWVDAIDDVRTAEQRATRNAFYAVVQALDIVIHCTQERVIGLYEEGEEGDDVVVVGSYCGWRRMFAVLRAWRMQVGGGRGRARPAQPVTRNQARQDRERRNRERNRKRMLKMKKMTKGTGGPGTTTGGGVGSGGGGSEPAPLAEGYAPRANPGCLATELEPDSELERVFDGDEGGGDDAHGEYIDGVVADALGDGEMGVSSGAHGGAGF